MKLAWIALLLWQVGCLLPDDSDRNLCESPTAVPKVFGGTETPSVMPLTDGEVLAIGTFETCSGTLIAPTWVITAKHCGLTEARAFCVGERFDDPSECQGVQHVFDHPTLDVTLVELWQSPLDQLPATETLAPLDDDLDCSFMGEIAEAAGYGTTETGGVGSRLFTAEPIVSLTRDKLIVDGEGRRGLCRGDSGGPVLVLGSDDDVRIAGVLSTGEATCRGLDSFVRLDRVRDWIADLTGR